MMSLPTLSMTKMPATVVTCVMPAAEEKTGAKAADVCVDGSFHSSVDAAVDSVNIFAGAGVDGSSSSRSGVEQDYLNLPGCRCYPRWCQDVLGLHPNNVFKQLQEAAFADRAAAHMRYRGHTLDRSKFFLVDNLTDKVPIYNYPGFQSGSITHEYKLIGSNPLVQRIVAALSPKCSINNVIGTLYTDAADNIGWHSDKDQTIDGATPIFLLSFGAQRPLVFRRTSSASTGASTAANPPNGHLKQVCVPMEPGSLFVLGHSTNKAWQHAILPSADPIGARISLVLRKISKFRSMEYCQQQASKTERERAAKRLKRDHEGSTAHDAVDAVAVAGNDDANVRADDSVSLSSPSSASLFFNPSSSNCASDGNDGKRKASTVKESE